jgi:PucR C-terminal helix-turn-helix domain/GGDEF-like domain
MHTRLDRAGTLRHLLDLTAACDDAAPVIEAAGDALGHPLGLVDAAGAALGCSPSGDKGQRALAVARSAARASVVPPPGWDITAIRQETALLGVLAVGDEGPQDEATRGALALLPTMLAGQLRRAALVRLQRATLVHRLVSDPALTVHRARREAAGLGMRLAGAYWVALVDARGGELRSDIAERVEREAGALVEGSLTTSRAGHLVLLHPGELAPGPAEWFGMVAERIRELSPSSRAQLIASDHAVELSALSTYVGDLEQLRRFEPRAGGDAPIAWRHEYALDRLLHENVEPETAARFVEEQLGTLLRTGRQQGMDLVDVLEASLDFPCHEEAARHCFMHRNTFRHHLRLAYEGLDRCLDHPADRLAVHVALKLRHLTDEASTAVTSARSRTRTMRHRSRRLGGAHA